MHGLISGSLFRRSNRQILPANIAPWMINKCGGLCPESLSGSIYQTWKVHTMRARSHGLDYLRGFQLPLDASPTNSGGRGLERDPAFSQPADLSSRTDGLLNMTPNVLLPDSTRELGSPFSSCSMPPLTTVTSPASSLTPIGKLACGPTRMFGKLLRRTGSQMIVQFRYSFDPRLAWAQCRPSREV